jgi:hypothetical protein
MAVFPVVVIDIVVLPDVVITGVVVVEDVVSVPPQAVIDSSKPVRIRQIKTFGIYPSIYSNYLYVGK